MAEATIGHNGGPTLHRLSTKQKIELIRRIMEMPDLTAAQKCIGVGIVVESDREGLAEVTTKRLQVFASVNDRETVYRATKALEAKSVIQTNKEKGKPNRFRVMPTHVMDAIIDAYNEKKGSPVKPDGLPTDHPVGFEPTSPVKPVGLKPTSQEQTDTLQTAEQKEKSPRTPLKENNTQDNKPHHPAAAREDDGFSCLNGTAVDLVKFLARHCYVTEDVARNMLRTNIQTFGAQAMLDAYATTLAAMTAQPLAQPYRYLIKVAREYKNNPPASKKPSVPSYMRR